jgi:tetratricopeptide (TPR) repeat protein
LNGLLSGNYDQVAQGMGFSSSLLIANPGDVYGFYGLTTNALFKEDVATLTDLVNRWPNANRSDLEFKLASMLVGSRSGQRVPAIELGKQLLQEFPNSSRVRVVTLAASIDAWNEAQQILGDRTSQDLVRDFQTKKAAIEKSGVSAPEIFNSLERKLQRKGALGGSSKPAQETRVSERNEVPKAPAQPAKETHSESKAAKPKEMPLQKPTEESMTQRLNQRAAQKMMTGGPAPATKESTPAEPKPAPIEAKNDSLPAPGTTAPDTATAQAAPPATQAAAPTQTAPKGSSTAKAPPTRLPKPTEQLVAQTKQEHHEESEAAKLFRQGVSFLSANKADEAIVAFQKSLRFDPDYAESYKKLGEIYMKRQDKERALRSFKIYLQLKPDSSDKQVVEGWISSLQ